jgi:hypothetical protein
MRRVMELVRCDGVGCDRDGVEFLVGVLPAIAHDRAAMVRIRLWLCPDHAAQMLEHGMHRPSLEAVDDGR